MKDLSEFNDVLQQDIQVEEASISEFEFAAGFWCLRRERNHWEITYESDEGAESIFVEREEFIDGKFIFEIDGADYELTLEDFDRLDKFYNDICIKKN